MMGSSVHLHMSCMGQDIIAIVPTMDMQGDHPVDFSVGQQLAFTFGGNVIHMFSKEGEQRNLFGPSLRASRPQRGPGPTGSSPPGSSARPPC